MSSTATVESIELASLGAIDNKSQHHVSEPDEAGQTVGQNEAIEPIISRWHAAVLIINVSSITLLGTMLNGFLIVRLPSIAIDLALPANLLLWPASVFA